MILTKVAVTTSLRPMHPAAPSRRLELMDTPRRLELSVADRAIVVWATAVVGALLAVALPAVLELADDHDLPVPSWLGAIARIDAAWLTWGRPAVGVLVGAVAGLLIIDQAWRLDVTRERIVARQGTEVHRIPRPRVGAIYRTGRRTVVIEDADGTRLFKGTVEGNRSAVPMVFTALGYPWDGDV